MKPLLKNIFRRIGLHLFTDGSLPTGANWLVDLKKQGLAAAPVVFDVGANIGQTIGEVRQTFTDARIFAFEPFPATFDLLRQNADGLKDVRLFPVALGAAPATLSIKAEGTSVLNTLVGAATPPVASGDSPGSTDEVPIAVQTLASVVEQQQIDAIDVLKIDTEGYDLEVLRGAETLLEAGRVHFVYTEVTFCAENRQNTPFAPIFDYLSARNFRFMGLYETYSLHHFAEPNVFCNALFMHRGFRAKA